MRAVMLGSVTIAILFARAASGAAQCVDAAAKAVETCAEGGELTIPGQPIDLELDKATAIKVAETILVKVYGKQVLEERPWIVKETKSCFTISGTWKHGPNTKGGVAVIEISRKTAAVLAIIHGK